MWLSACRRGVAVEWFLKFGGVNPRFEQARGQLRPRLSADEREQIMIGAAGGESIRAIARRLGRHPSTVMREIANNGVTRGRTGRYRARYRFGARQAGCDAQCGYSARIAQLRSEARARRPTTGKLGRCAVLRAQVQALLVMNTAPSRSPGCWPRPIPTARRCRCPTKPSIRPSTCKDAGNCAASSLHACGPGVHCVGHATVPVVARPRPNPGMVNISERPAEAADRAVPGHWEGDLILGKNQASQIGTLVERSTGFVQLLHLPARRDPRHRGRCDDLDDSAIARSLRRSLTWDQGKEMAQHTRISVDAGIDIYFCDPHSPWQRGSNENTNGLLRQYFPKGTDLSVHSAQYLAEVAAELNGRPRKRFGWDNPTNRLNQLLLSPPTQSTVATKP